MGEGTDARHDAHPPLRLPIGEAGTPLSRREPRALRQCKKYHRDTTKDTHFLYRRREFDDEPAETSTARRRRIH